MNLNDDHLSLYDVLELTPDATPQEIRSAYLRLKSSYNKDNVAHYSLFSREETEQMVENIENAYIVLSNPESRRNYDQSHGLIATPTTHSPQSSTDMLRDTFQPSDSSSTREAVRETQAPSATNSNAELEAFLENEEEWSGSAIRHVRETKRISIDDLSDYTRISKNYLRAIEEEDYKNLPAMVYIRGFIQQLSRRLKIPSEKVTQKYIERLKAASPEKA